MNRKFVWMMVTSLMVLLLVLASCGPAAEAPAEGKTIKGQVTQKEQPATEEEEEAEAVPEELEADEPQYGGWINIGFGGSTVTEVFDPIITSSHGWTSYVTYERLAIADWLRGPGGTGEYEFKSSYFPDEYKTGNLAESWEWIDCKTIKFTLRKGVRFHSIPPVNGREMVAEDVRFSFARSVDEPKCMFYTPPEAENRPYVEVIDKYTFVLYYPYCDTMIFHDFATRMAVVPHEVGDEFGTFNDPDHQVGTGAYMLDDVIPEVSSTWVRNPTYWKYDPFNPQNKLPYPDGLKILVIPDWSTHKAAFRTGKTDLLRYVGIDDANELWETVPWAEWRELDSPGTYLLWMNTRNEPFSNKLVRQAISMGIDQPLIQQTMLKGRGVINSWPLQPFHGEAYVPYEELPENLKKLYEYHPDEARQLLAEAGYPNGFKATMDIGTSQTYQDYAAIFKEQLATIGIEVEIKVHEAFGDIIYSQAYDAFTITWWGNLMPVDVFGYANGGKESIYSFSLVKDPVAEENWLKYNNMTDPAQQMEFLKEETLREIELAWEVPMPAAGGFWFWQPWFKNFHGEAGIGPEPEWGDHGIFQFIWIDQALKQEMGFR